MPLALSGRLDLVQHNNLKRFTMACRRSLFALTLEGVHPTSRGYQWCVGSSTVPMEVHAEAQVWGLAPRVGCRMRRGKGQTQERACQTYWRGDSTLFCVPVTRRRLYLGDHERVPTGA